MHIYCIQLDEFGVNHETITTKRKGLSFKIEPLLQSNMIQQKYLVHILLFFLDIKQAGLTSTLLSYLTSYPSMVGERFESSGGGEETYNGSSF